MQGYIKIPRDLFASEEWLTPRIFGKVDAQLDLLQMATYAEERIIHCKSGDVTLRRGQLLTTMRSLAERWGWSAASVYRFLSSLREWREGCIRIRIETTPTDGKTLVTIVDYDRWDYTADETRFETAFETTSETHFETMNETYDDYENSCNSDRCEVAKTDRETADETRFETASETADETRNETLSELKYSNTRIERKDSNTHTVDTVKGGYRGEVPTYTPEQIEEAISVMNWTARNHSRLFSAYRFSIHPRAICDFLARYDRADVEYIISSMAAKEAYSPTATFAHTFEVFVRNDHSVKSRAEKAEATRPKERRYSYAEMCDEVSRLGITTADFTPVYQQGSSKPAYWVPRTTAIAN